MSFAKKYLIILYCLFEFVFHSSASTFGCPTRGIMFGYYNDKFGSHGMRLGIEVPVWQRFRTENDSPGLKHAFIAKANLNVYNHMRHHVGLSLTATVGYRFTSKSGLIVEPLHIGTGFHYGILDGATYEPNSAGGFTELSVAGNASFILPYIQLFGIGYDFRQKSRFPLSFMISADPYFQHSVNTQTRVRLATPVCITYYFK